MNIVWIFIDSVRRYHSDDDRSRLKVMDKFNEKSIEFTEVVTSAPSTVMSISAMMTGQHSFILGTNYNDFRFDRDNYPTLTSILHKRGWDCYAALMHPDIREKLTCLNIYPRYKWPMGFSHGKWWSNSEIYNFIKKALQKESRKFKPEKKFWFIDYNCRKDPEISNKVEDTFNLFYKHGYDHDNSIFILCSDHGYPDPSRGITPELLKKKKLTHDIFMTDDNIMIPFFLSLPGIKNIKYDKQISTINIFPTLIDYLGLKIPNSNLTYSESLLPFLKSKPKNSKSFIARSDARFLGQTNRICCIRSKKYKLIYDYEKNKYLYNFINGLVEEERNESTLSKKEKNGFQILKDYLIETDSLALSLFKKKYSTKFKKMLNIFKKNKILKIFIYSNSLQEFNKNILDIFELELSKNHSFNIELLASSPKKNFSETKNNLLKYSKYKFDLKIFIQTDNEYINYERKLFSKISSKKSLEVASSLTGEINQNRITRATKTIWNSRMLYIYEPFLIIKLLVKFLKYN